MRILICDDEPLAIERLSRLVVQLGHEVVAHACNGRDAIELVDQHQPDVVLLDIQMPEMNGLLCAEQLGTFDPMPAIIFCTAYDDHALDAFKSKAQGYLLKPIAQDDLARVLHQLPRLNQAQITHIKHCFTFSTAIPCPFLDFILSRLYGLVMTILTSLCNISTSIVMVLRELLGSTP